MDMHVPYFTSGDHAALSLAPCPNVQGAQDTAAKLEELHRTLYRRIRERNWDLHPHWEKTRIIAGSSAACHFPIEGLALSYLRSKEQAVLVERLMGRDESHAAASVDCHRHPVIEIRITPEHFAIELILNPISWWDQRNLIGKLAIDRHRLALRSMLQRMDGEFRFGFWDGNHLSDMHLTNRHLLRGSILEDWMSTFGDGQDWLRAGVWYEPEHPMLNTGRILNETLHRMGALYELYSFMLWTSNNNFHSFYRKGAYGSGSRGRDY